MRLFGNKKHLSVEPFEPIDLPDLVVLTGINGSGKSQFLAAIEQSAITLGGPAKAGPIAARQNPDILRLVNGAAPLPGLSGSGASQLVGPRDPAADELVRSRGPFYIMLPAIIGPQMARIGKLLSERLGERVEVEWHRVPEGPQALIEQYGLEGDDAAEVEAAFREAANALAPQHPPIGDPLQQSFRLHLENLANRLGVPRWAVTERQFTEMDAWGTFSAFDPTIARIFAAYRDEWTRNALRRFRDEEDGTATALTQGDFEERYGPPPWSRLNDTIAAFGLDYEVERPAPEPDRPAVFSLRRRDNGAIVQFSQLSSGEQVILRFALSLFPFDPVRTGVALPKLLLLDEMDASLHPEMVSRWLNTIKEGLVERQGIACILTTHSPTTVALAPEESLYELELGKGPPRKVSRQHALNRLTFGVPTLAINYSGRRQVFVESDTDASTYEQLGAILKARLDLPTTLSFLSTGIRKDRQEQGTGCAAVRKIVSELRAGANTSVFGLIDWDGQNEPEGYVHVLAQGTHYALDNLLLHPTLVGALLLRDNADVSGFHGTFVGLGGMDVAGLQALADAVQKAVTYPDSSAATSGGALLGGFDIEVSSAHQTMNGHALEDALAIAWPRLKQYTGKGRGKLTEAVVTRVLQDYPAFTPVELAAAFTAIARAEAH